MTEATTSLERAYRWTRSCYAFREGQLPEAIQQDFPTLQLAQIYGTIAYYLEHQNEMDSYLAEAEREFESSAIPLSEANPGLFERIQRIKTKQRV